MSDLQELQRRYVDKLSRRTRLLDRDYFDIALGGKFSPSYVLGFLQSSIEDIIDDAWNRGFQEGVKQAHASFLYRQVEQQDGPSRKDLSSVEPQDCP